MTRSMTEDEAAAVEAIAAVATAPIRDDVSKLATAMNASTRAVKDLQAGVRAAGKARQSGGSLRGLGGFLRALTQPEQRPALVAKDREMREALALRRAGAQLDPDGRPLGAESMPIRNAMSERVPSEGGFLVGEDWTAELLMRSLETAIMRPRALPIPSQDLYLPVPMIEDTDHSAGSVFGGVTASWTAESTALVATVPTLGRARLEARKLAILMGNVPNELVEDGKAFNVYINKALPEACAFYEDQGFIAGDGVGQPQGVLNASCAILVTRNASSAVQLVDIAKMQARLLPTSQARAIWLCSPDVLAQLLELYFNFGSATSGIASAQKWLHFDPDRGNWCLLGRDLFPTEHVKALGTAGDLVLVDPSEYIIEDRLLMEASASPLGRGFQSDETDFKLINRVDGRMWRTAPMTPANSSATLSSVVILN